MNGHGAAGVSLVPAAPTGKVMAKKSAKSAYEAERTARQRAVAEAEAAFREAQREAEQRRDAWWAAARHLAALVTPNERKIVAEHPEWIAALRAGDLESLRTAGGARAPLVRNRSYYDCTQVFTERAHRLLRVAELIDAERQEMTP